MLELVRTLTRLPWMLPRAGLSVAAALGVPRPTAGAGGPVGLPWTELGNRLAVYQAFRGAGRSVAPGAAPAAREALASLGGIAPWYRLWRAEGLAYQTARSVPAAVGELLEAGGDELGVPLHSGVGLGLAVAVVEDLAGAADPRPVVEAFLERARHVARPEWEGAVVEALGLAVRTLEPHRLEAWGEVVELLDGEAADLYWHGAGRGLYFAPTLVAPYGRPAARTLERAATEAPGPARGRQAVAGAVWALALVNLPDPAVLADLLLHLQRREARGDEVPWSAVEHGVAAAVRVAERAGEKPLLQPYLDPDAVPVAVPIEGRKAWLDHVVAPVWGRPGSGSGDPLTSGRLFRFEGTPVRAGVPESRLP